MARGYESEGMPTAASYGEEDKMERMSKRFSRKKSKRGSKRKGRRSGKR
jgi:hypothetical protein